MGLEGDGRVQVLYSSVDESADEFIADLLLQSWAWLQVVIRSLSFSPSLCSLASIGRGLVPPPLALFMLWSQWPRDQNYKPT